MKNTIWDGTIVGKTDKNETVFFANMTDKQFWWEIDDNYSAFGLDENMLYFVANNLKSHCNLVFNTDNETYSKHVKITSVRRV